jgi:hypothetical protein
MKKVKFKVITKKQQTVLKTVRGSSPNNAVAIHTTTSPSQSPETVLLKGLSHQIRFA